MHIRLTVPVCPHDSTRELLDGFKFSMDVMLLETTLYSYFKFTTIDNTNMVDERTCEVGATLLHLNIESYMVMCCHV
jgi:hypothetical protein